MTKSTETITHISRQEGSDWIQYDMVIPPDNILERLVAAIGNRSGNGCKVTSELTCGLMHSFKTNKGRRWDCINGWTS